MHELFLIKVSETLTAKALMHPVTIMTRAPVAKQGPDYLIWTSKVCWFLDLIDGCSYIILILNNPVLRRKIVKYLLFCLLPQFYRQVDNF